MSLKIPLYQVDAFAERLFQGNPAAVCPLDHWLPDHLLQSIALENNLSETAFYVAGDGEYTLRWFTPVREVDLCGHATLAAAHVLFEISGVETSTVRFQSRSGPLAVSREGGILTLDFPAQPAVPCEVPDEMVEALGAHPQACFRAADYMVVFGSEAELRALQPDFRRLQSLDLRGVIVTAPGDCCDFVSRFFAPKCGIDEDPVTGSAHCTLAPYWAQQLGKSDLRAQQLSSRRGDLDCRVAEPRVFISGRAITYLKGEIMLDARGAAHG